MATDAPESPAADQSPRSREVHPVVAMLKPLASLKLTVVLFVLSIVLIMIGTLAQEDEGMWDVIQNYFRTWICWVPFEVFFPESFFPNMASIPGRFPFAGGWLIGTLLAINLISAHIVRFKAQAKGKRLAFGATLMAAAIGVIAMIVYTAHRMNGADADPAIWDTVWTVIRGGTAMIWIASVFWVLSRIDNNRVIFWSKVLTSVALGALAFWLVVYGGGTRLDDASLRILWQLMQGTFAGVFLLIGAWMVFKRRAGIVVIHMGVGLLMLGELVVSMKAVEQRMFIREGETVSIASEPRVMELAVIDRSPADHDSVISIPTSLLAKGKSFSHEALPFDIELVDFLRNCNLTPTLRLKRAAAAGFNNVNDMLAFRLLIEAEQRRDAHDGANLATTGTGQNIVAEHARPFGASVNAQNEAAAYIRIKPKSAGDDSPTLLVAQRYGDAKMIMGAPTDLREVVKCDGKTYELALRFRREVKPYSLTLEDIRKEDYVGTSTPRDYSSYVLLSDPANDVNDQPVRIWMNNPLRYGGQTFYQSDFHALPSGEATTLSLVSNFGWMIPYIACMLVVVGLVSHFLLTLTRFIGRQTRVTDTTVELAEKKSMARQLAIPAIAAAICLMVLGRAMRPKPTIIDEMNISEFAEIPIVHEGRVKPIDTLARNALKVVSNKQSYNDETLTETSRQPAVKWFLDVITGTEDADKHKVISITNLDVVELLGLEPRRRFMYAVDEFESKLDDLDREARKSFELSRETPERLTLRDKALLDTHRRLMTISRLRDAFEPTPFPPLPSEEMRKNDPQAAERRVQQIAEIAMGIRGRKAALMERKPPLVVPRPVRTESGTKTEWLPYGIAVDTAYIDSLLRRSDVDEETLAWDRMLRAYSKGDARTFNEQVASYKQRMTSIPVDEVIMPRIGFESYFNAFSPFYWCMGLYVIGFVITACGWLGWFEPLRRLSTWVLIFTLAVHTFALLGRIYISGRPPVTNLYSSAVFIGWGAVALSIALEFLFKVSIGNVVAAISGFATLFVAHNLAGDQDTFTVLVAVLDTQFWLATHVVCITLGYTTTFVAGGLATIYILGGVFTKALNKQTASTLARMTYGVICFAIFFSFFGTVLGGLWADDSWGRFWGWDPKENGALIIVIWNALILHARWGGMIRDRGLAVLAIIGNIATAWSWFGVNELGIGLHAYSDFDKSAKLELGLYVLSQVVLVGIGCLPLAMWRGKQEVTT